jgi:hypothetical protein
MISLQAVVTGGVKAMGGGAFTLEALPFGAPTWCSGEDVIDALNKLFNQDPTNQQYQDAKTASLDYFKNAVNTGVWGDLWAAYGKAFEAAGIVLPAGWSSYLDALGNLSQGTGNSGNIVTTAATVTSSAILTFSNVPGWMANDLIVSDTTTPRAITGGQTVSSFDATTVTLTANVNAKVKLGDTIFFSIESGEGHSNIKKIARARYQGLKNDKKMYTQKHNPHDHHSSGHRVKVTHEPDGSITITSPFIPPPGPLKNRNR